jgi:hypothetical protein
MLHFHSWIGEGRLNQVLMNAFCVENSHFIHPSTTNFLILLDLMHKGNESPNGVRDVAPAKESRFGPLAFQIGSGE